MDIKKFKGAIFDLDGTLLDSIHVWHNVDKAFFAKRNLPLTADYIDAIKNMHFPTAAVYTKERYNLPESTEGIMKEWYDLCFEAYENHILLKDGAYEFLQMLCKNGIKIAYATANEEKLCRAALTKNGVWDLFSACAYVSETKVDKSQPDVYLLASERLRLEPSECIVFEDILQGILGAEKGGFATCGVYDDSSLKDKEEIFRNADYYINSFSELLYK